MIRIILTCLLAVFIKILPAQTFHNVNIDKATAAAMTSAYGAEAGVEAFSTASLQEILNHYKLASVATAGIYLSKKKDRAALLNPGLFATEENYYYKRILDLVKNRIMPKFITVASKMVKQPENAIYWGPYLLKTTDNVEQLCKQFELLATNGKLSFKDVTFLLLNDDLRKLFDLTKIGDVDWKGLLSKLGDFDDDLSIDDIKEDFSKLGSMLAGIGSTTASSALQETSKIGKVFHMKPKEIKQLFDHYKEEYEKYRDAGNVKNLLMEVIQTSDADGVARLFKASDYNIANYISNYIKELQGQYYTQRWYIYTNESGSKVLCDYTPKSYSSYDDSRWGTAWNSYESPKDKEICHTLTQSEKEELKKKANSQSGWSEKKVEEYNKDNPGHNCSITYSLNHKNFKKTYKTGLNKHFRRICFYSYSVKVVDSWSIQNDVYEEIFDSQTMDFATFKKKMQSKLKYYNDMVSDIEGNTITYELASEPPHYYTMADEKKMEGCNSVSFLATCDGGANLAEGSFTWKENGKQGNRLEDPKSKDFAMRNTPSADDSNKELQKQKEAKEKEISTLESQITSNDKKQKELLDQIKQAQLANNQVKVDELSKEYDAISDDTATLKAQLKQSRQELQDINNAINEYYDDLSDNLDGDYRIPSNMTEIESMYQIQWNDEGEWVNGYDCYIFIRHGYCPTIKSAVTYSATLKLARKPKYFLGVRIHRAVMTVDFKLASEYSSENVVEVMNLDMKKSEEQRAEEVNKRLHELMEDMPDYSIRVSYNYAGNPEPEEDPDAIHLLWASDRLDVAREVEAQLTAIYSQLVLIEKVMTNRETILDFFKHKILDIVTREGRSTIAEYALGRWESAGMAAMSKQEPSTGK